MTPDVSIVIVNWNTRDLLRDCLRSIGEQTQRPYETIVVDNASGDGSAEMVTAEFPSVTLIRNDANRGFAAANNQGIRIARGRYVLLLNPDTVILDGAIDRMVAWCEPQPDVGAAGCQVWEDAVTIQRTCFVDQGPLNIFLIETGLHRLFPSLFGEQDYSTWDHASEREVDVVAGMFLMAPKYVVDHVGALDEIFFVYSEEIDWCRRIREAGYRCVFTPVARIIHRDGGKKSSQQIRPRMYVQLQKSKLLYVRKHFSPLGALSAKATFITTQIFRWAAFGLLAIINGDKENTARSRLARDAVKYHLTGIEPM